MKKTGYERQEDKGKYWSISFIDGLYPNYEYNDPSDDAAYDTANYYSDENIAKNNARADNLMRQLRRFAAENNDSEIDWDNKNQKKYYISFSYKGNLLNCILSYSEANSIRNVGTVYFSSLKVLDNAKDIFYDELMWYFTEYCDHVVEDKDESNVGCELCKSGDLDIVGIKNNRIAVFSYNKKLDEEKFKFCPQCGRRLD